MTLLLDNAYLVLAVSMAFAAGLLGSFAIMRKMTLASDPFSHIALPGLGLALIFKFNPLLGASAALLAGAVVVWALEKRTGISIEALIGVIFSVSLSIGALITPNEDLLEALLGGYRLISPSEMMIGLIISLGIVFFLLRRKEELVLTILSPELAQTSGLRVNRLNLYFLLVFALTIILGLRYLGVLLMGSLIIIPAAVGKNLGRSLNSMLAISLATAILATGAGLWLANRFGFESGPSIITMAAFIFFLSLLVKPKS
jgi:ABC-type Mn2+/Zn2+ transport system permease subunit